MGKQKQNKFLFLRILLLFLLVSLSGLSSIYGFEKFVTYVLIPSVFFIVIALNKYSLKSLHFTSVKIFILLILLNLILLLPSRNIEVGMDNIIKMSGVLLTILIVFELILNQSYNFRNTILFGFVLSFYVIVYYLLINSSPERLIISTGIADRVSFGVNANTYSYYSFFANFALFYLIELEKRKIFIYISFLTIALGIYVSFLTASRSGLIFTLIIALVYWLFINGALKKNRWTSLFLIAFLLPLSLIKVFQIYENSYLKSRVERSVESGDSRELLAQNAIQVFIDNPFMGVGPGQFFLYSYNKGSFSHNAFTEIAANVGFLGLLLLILLYGKPVVDNIRAFRKNSFKIHKNIFKLNILFFISFFLINNIYVFYLTTFGMMFFALVVGIHYETFNKKYDQKKIE